MPVSWQKQMQEGKVVAYGCPMKKKLQKRRIVREETQQIMNRDKDKDKVLKLRSGKATQESSRRRQRPAEQSKERLGKR